jgi:hypothetical protein
MTDTTPGIPMVQPGRDDLTPRIFMALYAEFELRAVDGTYVATPKGTPCFTGRSLGEIARQICEHGEPTGDRQSGVSLADPS